MEEMTVPLDVRNDIRWMDARGGVPRAKAQGDLLVVLHAQPGPAASRRDPSGHAHGQDDRRDLRAA